MRKPKFYSGKPVYSLQTMLRTISFADAGVLPLIPDGTYGSNTYASVLSFQEAFGLPQTGETDLQTWTAVAEYYNRLLPQITPLSSPSFMLPGNTVSPGTFSPHLYTVQAMLAALADYFVDLSPPELSGRLDPVTQQGLAWLQTAAGLPQTGTPDTITGNFLSAVYATMLQTASTGKV